MEMGSLLALVALAGVVLVPLGREYAEFRREWGLGRLKALATTLLVVPALAFGIAVSLPLAAEPAAQWTASVLVTLLAYSLATAGVRSTREPARAPRQLS